MPIFDYQCNECEHIWENVEVWSNHAPTQCPKCKSKEFSKVIGSAYQVRMDATVMKHELPDPIPPLEEFRGNKRLKQAGKGEKWDKPHQDLKDMAFKTDKYGNRHWYEKRRSYFGAGGSRRSSAERRD